MPHQRLLLRVQTLLAPTLEEVILQVLVLAELALRILQDRSLRLMQAEYLEQALQPLAPVVALQHHQVQCNTTLQLPMQLRVV
jgi:hypothetical protein